MRSRSAVFASRSTSSWAMRSLALARWTSAPWMRMAPISRANTAAGTQV